MSWTPDPLPTTGQYRAPIKTHQQIVAGDDYKLEDGRALVWTSFSWPDTAGATLAMIIGHEQYNLYGMLPLTLTGTVPVSPDAPTTVSMEVAGSATTTIPQDEYDYELTATLVDGSHVTLAIGKLTVEAAPGTSLFFPPSP